MRSRSIHPWFVAAAFGAGLLVGLLAAGFAAPFAQAAAETTTPTPALTWKQDDSTLVIEAHDEHTGYLVFGHLDSGDDLEALDGGAVDLVNSRLELPASQISDLQIFRLNPEARTQNRVLRPCNDNPLVDCPIPRPPPPPWGFCRILSGGGT